MSCNLEFTYNDDRWATIVSPDQEGCNEYLEKKSDLISGKNILHVGTGNSSLFLAFGAKANRIDGITIMDSEIDVAKTLVKNKPYTVFNFNKYDARNYANMPKDYDVVVDNNAKQHACCQLHWEDYYKAVLGLLVQGGVFLTHTQGFAPHTEKVGHLTVSELISLLPLNFELVEEKSFTNSAGCYPVLIVRKNEFRR